MPELPEVETIVRALRDGSRGYAALVGRQFQSARILWNRTLVEPKPATFQYQIVGQNIENITRRGKYIHFLLDDYSLVFHLRMSGDFRTEENDKPAQIHDRAVFTFYDGINLYFNDTRKFGRIWLVNDTNQLFSKLGPEPFDALLTHEDFYRRLRERKRQIKTLLLDQSFLAGVGNIYADESLHVAGIHPCQSASSLTFHQSSRLLDSLRIVLQSGIDKQGASIDWVYRDGSFQNEFRVYQRTGSPCLTCNTLIERQIIGQRGTHFCPKCQPHRK